MLRKNIKQWTGNYIHTIERSLMFVLTRFLIVLCAIVLHLSLPIRIQNLPTRGRSGTYEKRNSEGAVHLELSF